MASECVCVFKKKKTTSIYIHACMCVCVCNHINMHHSVYPKSKLNKKIPISCAISHLHPSKANYSPHGNLEGSSHQKTRGVHQAIIPDESALLPRYSHSHSFASLAAHYSLSADPLTAGCMCRQQESIMTLGAVWKHAITLSEIHTKNTYVQNMHKHSPTNMQ